MSTRADTQRPIGSRRRKVSAIRRVVELASSSSPDASSPIGDAATAAAAVPFSIVTLSLYMWLVTLMAYLVLVSCNKATDPYTTPTTEAFGAVLVGGEIITWLKF